MPAQELVLDVEGQQVAPDQWTTQIAAVEPQWLRHPELLPDGASRLEGPSTLTLALIGAATLVAYRSIHDRLVGGKAIAGRVQPPRKGSKRRGRAA